MSILSVEDGQRPTQEVGECYARRNRRRHGGRGSAVATSALDSRAAVVAERRYLASQRLSEQYVRRVAR